jgi:hypothetical protein
MNDDTQDEDFIQNMSKIANMLSSISGDVDLTGIDSDEENDNNDDFIDQFMPPKQSTNNNFQEFGGMKFNSLTTNIKGNIPGVDIISKEMSKKRKTDQVITNKESAQASSIHEGFKNNLIKIKEIDDEINKLSTRLSELRSMKAELQKTAIVHMAHHELDVAELPTKDKYSMVKSKSKVNQLTRAKIPIKLRDFLVKEEKMTIHDAERIANQFIKWINDNPEFINKVGMRRTKPRTLKV